MKPPIESPYPLHQFIKGRWSPRAFDPAPLSEETALTLLEAARWAASCNNAQPWRFIYATKENTLGYAKLFECLGNWNKAWAKAAPLLMMTLVKVNFDGGDKPNAWALHDLGLAIGNLTLQASSMELFVHNMAGFSVETAEKTLAIPAGLRPVTMIAIGRLGSPDTLSEPVRLREVAAQERKPLAEIILAGAFDKQ